MYFNDRVALGKTLAGNLQHFKGEDAVILCLKESSLLTCLAMAMNLRAWVYPLLSVPVYSQDLAHELYGAFGEDGEFCFNPERYDTSVDQLPPDQYAAIDNQKYAAAHTIQEQAIKYEMMFNKHCMDGRDVIVAGDVVTEGLPLALASQLLSTLKPKSISVAIGNTSPSTAQLTQLIAEKPLVLDVISGIVFDDEHYFEHADSYTPDQKHTLTQHITTYWQ